MTSVQESHVVGTFQNQDLNSGSAPQNKKLSNREIQFIISQYRFPLWPLATSHKLLTVQPNKNFHKRKRMLRRDRWFTLRQPSNPEHPTNIKSDNHYQTEQGRGGSRVSMQRRLKLQKENPEEKNLNTHPEYTLWWEIRMNKQSVFQCLKGL